MSPDVEQPVGGDARGRESVDLAEQPVDLAEQPTDAADPAQLPHGAHHILRDSPEDRWRWRAKIRQNAHQLRIYRFGVGLVGTFLVVLGFVSGPLPGPGGIPLVLLGLAVMASEFVWAERLMRLFKAQLIRFRSWSRARQTAAFAVFFACCGLFAYGYLLTLGAPTWLPGSVDDVLARLPGL
jgi:uncharacterized protein (TIGR02611 family)